MRYSETSLKEEVRRRRIIWDYTKKSHANRNLVDKAFKDIADLYSEDEIDAQFIASEWERLKTNRSRRMRRYRSQYKSGAPGGALPVNFQADDMGWLDDAGKDLTQWHGSNIVVNPNPSTSSITFTGGAGGRDGRREVQEEDCSVMAQRAFERRQEEENQRRPPASTITTVSLQAAEPANTLSPRPSSSRPASRLLSPAAQALLHGRSPAGQLQRTLPTSSPSRLLGSSLTGRGRSTRSRRKPERYSPTVSGGGLRRRRLNDSATSLSSTTSAAGSVGSAAPVTASAAKARRQRRRATRFDIDSQVLSTIQETDAVENQDQDQDAGVQPLGASPLPVTPANQPDGEVRSGAGSVRRSLFLSPGLGRRSPAAGHGGPSPGPGHGGPSPGPGRGGPSPGPGRGGPSPGPGRGGPSPGPGRGGPSPGPRRGGPSPGPGRGGPSPGPRRGGPSPGPGRGGPSPGPAPRRGGRSPAVGRWLQNGSVFGSPPPSPEQRRAGGVRGRGVAARGGVGRGGRAGNAVERRRERAEERENEHRRWQMQQERHRQGLRDNLRVQYEARREQLEEQERLAGGERHVGQAAAENVEVALLREFLLAMNGDLYTSFGKMCAILLKQLPAYASGKWMVERFAELNHLCGLGAEELDEYFQMNDN